MSGHNNNECIYSVLTDIAVSYGAGFLGFKPEITSLLERWNQANQTIEPVADLAAGMNSLTRAVTQSKTVLADWASTSLCDPDPELHIHPFSPEFSPRIHREQAETTDRIATACIPFDHLVFFHLACNNFRPLQENKFADIRRELRSLNDEIGEEFQQNGWKLIPLNAGRNICLDNIPKHYHYLFPWYETWSDVPAESLDILVETMAGQSVDLEKITKDRLMMLQAEIESDTACYGMLIQQSVLAKEIPKAFLASHPLPAKTAKAIEPEPRKPPITSRISAWQHALHNFLDLMKTPQIIGAAVTICLLVVLATVYEGNQPSVHPVGIDFQIYRVTIGSNRGGEKQVARFELQTGESLDADDYFQIHFRLNKKGFVIVLQQSDTGKPQLKFSGSVNANEAVTLPGTSQAFQLDQTTHIENIYLLVSNRKIKNIDTILAKLPDNWAKEPGIFFPGATLQLFQFRH